MVKHKDQRESGVPCYRHTCRYHGARFEQSCSGEIGGKPAVITCQDYLLAKYKSCHILPGPWDDMVEAYCERNRHEAVCKNCSWLTAIEKKQLPERSVYQEDRREGISNHA